jgi:hypothetical protein
VHAKRLGPQLEQRKGVAAGRPDKPVRELTRNGTGTRTYKQLGRRFPIQSRRPQLGQADRQQR